MEDVAAIRSRVRRHGESIRKVARETGVSRNTVRRYLREAIEPEKRRPSRRPSPVREAITSRASELLIESEAWTAGKQRLTGTRLHRMLREEGFDVGKTVVREFVREWKRRRREVFVPLVYRPGELAEVDFFEVIVEIRGERQKAWMFVMRLMYSSRDFACIYDRQDQIAFLDGHVRAFEHFGGVPARIIYDNLRAAVSRFLRGSDRELSARFHALVAHYAFEACFARPRTGHDKGGVESRGRAIRLDEFVPIPSGDDLPSIGVRLLARLDLRLQTVVDAQGRSIGEKFTEETSRFVPLPSIAFRSAATRVCTVSSSALCRVDGARYSVFQEWAGLDVVAHVGVGEVEFVGNDGRRAVHPRMRFGASSVDYRHYLSELSRKPQAVRQVAPELTGALGPPFDELWRSLDERHGPKDAARTFAVVLKHVVESGREATAACVARALAENSPVLLALGAPGSATTEATVAVPAVLQDVKIEASSCAGFDRLLEVAS